MAEARYSMIAKIGADITDYSAKLKKAWQDAEEFRNKTEQSNNKAEGRVKAMLGAVSKAQAAFAGLAGTAVVAGFAALADQATTLENQMRAIGIATDESRAKIYRLAVETRTPIEATVGLLRSMSKSLRDQSLDQTIRQVATLNRLLTIGGLDAGQRGSVSLQLGQALQSGVLQGDELRALRESAPHELMEAIAKAAGGTVASLRDLGAQGKLTTEVVVRALNDLEQTSKDKFGSFQMTVKDSAQVLQTALVQAAGRMNEGLGFTNALANAQASLADMLMSSGDAAETLGRALNDMAQIALIAAGARGLAAVGTTLAGINAGAITLTGTFAALQGGFRGILALLGGPWGAAFFAAGVAAFALMNSLDSVSESLDKSAAAFERAKVGAAAVAELREAIGTDQKALMDAEVKIAEAIRDQATAAEDTARREAIAIQARISSNQKLLDLQQTIAKAALAQSAEEIEEARKSLVAGARTRLAADTNLRPPSGASPYSGFSERIAEVARIRQMSSEDVITEELRRIDAKVKAGKELLASEWEFLTEYSSLTEAEKRLAEERKTVVKDLFGGKDFTPDMATLTKEREAISAAMNELLEKEEKRNKKLADLRRVREELERQLTAGGQSPVELKGLNLRIQAADEEIRKLTDAEKRIDAIKEKIATLRQVIALAPYDQRDSMKAMLDLWEQKLADVESAGADVNNIDLTDLESGIASMVTWGDTLLKKFQEIAGVDLAQAVNRMSLPDVPLRWRDQLSRIDSTDPRAMAAAELIARKEDMVLEPYLDSGRIRKWRAGFGSDTYTDSLGQVHDVVKGQRVSEDDAIRDLARRIGVYFDEQRRLIGPAWDTFTDAQVAALASIQHNYGSLPPRILEELRSGNDKLIGEAIARLAMDNPENKGKDGLPVNYHRRMEEAQAFLGPEGSRQVVEMDEDSREAVKIAEARRDWLESMTEGVEKSRLEAEIAGRTAYEQQRILFIEQQKSAAKEQGIVWDEAMQAAAERAADAEIDKLRTVGALEKQREEEEAVHAERMAKIEEQKNEYLAYSARLQDAIVEGSIQTVFHSRSWGDALKNAGDLLSNVLDMYVDALARSALFGQGPLSQQTGGSGGLLGGLLNIGMSMFGGQANAPSVAMQGAGDPLGAALGNIFSPMASFASAFSLPTPTIGGNSRSAVDVNLNLDTNYLHAEIDTRADQRVNAAAPRIQVNAQRSMTERMRGSKKGWANT